MKCVYIVAIPESGGAMLTNSKCYQSIEAAEAELSKQRQQGIEFTKVFTLYVED